MKSTFNSTSFNKSTFNDTIQLYINKIEQVLRGASRNVDLIVGFGYIINKVENILRGAGRQSYIYFNKRISKLKPIIREQMLKFRVKRL